MVYKAPSSSTLETQLARAWAVQVNTGTEAAPVWTFVRGLDSVNPVSEKSTQDDGDIDSEGFGSQIGTEISFTLTLEGKRKGEHEAEVFTADPGQEYLRLKGDKTGYEGIGHVRWWRTDGDPEAREMFADVSYQSGGGGKGDLRSFTATLNSRGKPTDITIPTAPATPVTP